MGTLRVIRRWLIMVVALMVAVTITAGAASAASATDCRVRNVTRGGTYATLAQAVAKARNGDKLAVRGRCVTGRTVITRRLTIFGVRTARSGPPTLVGKRFGPPLYLTGEAAVTVKGLTIKGRKWVMLPQNRLGGGAYVGEGCRLTLVDSVIKDFRSRGFGGGIATEGGVVRLLGTSRIQGNRARSGAGIYAAYGRIVLLGKSTVRWNSGSGISSWGPVTMKWQTQVYGNTGTGIAGGPLVTLRDRASVHHNGGRGIVGDKAVLSQGSSVHHNRDGGIRAVVVELRDNVTVRDNSADFGAGIFEFEKLTMSGNAAVRDNTASYDGGGLFYRSGAELSGVVCAPAAGANVYGNAPDDCHEG